MVLEGKEGSGFSRPELGYVSWLAEKAALTPAVARTGEQAARSQAGEGPAQSAVSSARTVVPLWGGKKTLKPLSIAIQEHSQVPSLLGSQLEIRDSPCSLLCCLLAFQNSSRAESF